jgi:DnaD/phage-associated family protein
MARGRMIANSVATDKRFNSLTAEAALVYLMALPHLDRDGLILGDTMPFWGKVCPRRNEFMGHMADIIGEWINAGLVIAYECEEGTILYFAGFLKNQTGMHYDREAASGYPPPPGYIRTPKGLSKTGNNSSSEQLRTNSGQTPDTIATDSEPTPAESKVNKSKLKESDDHDGWRLVIDTYQHEIGVITPSVSDEIKCSYDEVGATLLIDAIKEASRNNIRKWSYVAGILTRWKANGRASPHSNGDSWQQYGGELPDYMKEG